MRVMSTSCRSPFEGDVCRLFDRLTGRRSDVALFESRDSDGRQGNRSLIFPRNALRIECRGRKISFTPLSDNGGNALLSLLPHLRKLGEVESQGASTVLSIPSVDVLRSEEARLVEISVLDALRTVAFCWEQIGESEFPLHLPGVFSYDFVEQTENLPPRAEDRFSFPDFVFWLPEEVHVIDHLTGTMTALRHRFGERDEIDREQGTLMNRGLRFEQPLEQRRRTDGSPCRNTGELVDVEDEQFERLVEQLKDHIVAGDVFQIVPSRTFSAPCDDPLGAYEELRRLNPSPYLFFLRFSGMSLFGSSPETCVKVAGSPREVELHPIAGTRPRGFDRAGRIDWDLDNRLEAELKLNEKELAEHMMLVDLARNDVAKVCKPGTRHVSKLLEVERFSHVMHLASVVSGELKEELDALHAYAASANMGTLVGAPKVQAAKLLRCYEVDGRGPYGGAVGYLTSDGELDTAIVIRAALVKEGTAHVRAGAGVVFDSDPTMETAETRAKARAVLRAVRLSSERGSLC